MKGHWKNKSHLVVEILPCGRSVKLMRPFVIHHVCKRRVVERIVVPAGTITNFASVPRPAWLFISPTGRYSYAACVHDWLYETQGDRSWAKTGFTQPWLREEADRVFREIMECMDVSPWRAAAMFWAVRAFGWYQWRKMDRINKILKAIRAYPKGTGFLPVRKAAALNPTKEQTNEAFRRGY